MGPFDEPDRYQLLEVRSSGMEGEVWRAQRPLDRTVLPVAIKIVHERHMANVKEWRKRWQRQAELLRTLDHPALVRVREFFEGPPPHTFGDSKSAERTLYLAMNWEKGVSLQDWVGSHPDAELTVTWEFIKHVAAGVDYLHSGDHIGLPVIHRDIKPANILISGPVVRLVDFGLARLHGDSSLTFGGTPHYLAPETWGGQFGPASDRYALGATAYFVLTGEPPPADEGERREALAQVRVADSEGLTALMLQMLAPEPGRRPESAVEWAAHIDDLLRAADRTVVESRHAPRRPAPPLETLPSWGASTEADHDETLVATPTRIDPPPEPAREVRPAPDITFVDPPATVFNDPVGDRKVVEPVPAERPRRRRVLLPLVAVALITAYLATAAATELWPFAPGTKAEPTVTSTPTVIALPDAGPVPAGLYSSSRFKPSVTFRLGDGWRTDANLSDSVDLTRTTQEQRQLSIVRVQRTYRPDAFNRLPDGTNTEATALAAIEKIADDLPKWLQSLPSTDKSEIRDINVAGRGGKAVDVTITGVNYPPSCTAGPCLLLFQREPSPPDNRTSAVIRLQGQRIRFEVFDAGVAKIVLMYSAPASELQRFVEEARSSFEVESFGDSTNLTSVSLAGPPGPVKAGDETTVTVEVKGDCVSSQAGTYVSFYEGAVRDDKYYGRATIRADGRASFPLRVRASNRVDLGVVVARYEGGTDCERSTSPPLSVPLSP